MGIGVSIFLLALGAILTFAVEFTVSGLDIAVIGVILMVVGLIGLAMALYAMRDRRGVVGTTAVVDRGIAPAATTVREERVVRDRDVY